MKILTTAQLAELDADGWVVADRGLHIRDGWLCILRRGSEMRVELVDHLPAEDTGELNAAPAPMVRPHGCPTCRRMMRINAMSAIRQRSRSDRRELVRLAAHFRDHCHHTGGAR